MKKRLSAFLLCFCLLLPGTALAAQDSTTNFQKSKSYAENFSDVSAGSAFHDNIAALYEYGLTVGKGDGTFGVRDNVSVGAAIVFAGRIHSLYQYGNTETGADAYSSQKVSSAYAPYVAYLKAEGILSDSLAVACSKPATRGQVAGILADCLPESALPGTWTAEVTAAHVTGSYIPDVNPSTPYAREILRLYGCGVSKGSDTRGAYYPSSKVTRGALAAMLTRMVDPSLRSKPEIHSSLYSAAGKTWGDLVSGNTAYFAAPVSTAAVESDVNAMLRKESSTLSLHYGRKLTREFVDDLMGEALSAVKRNCEQMYNSVNCSYQLNSGEVTLTFGAVGCTAAELREYRSYTLSRAIALHDQLWQSGQLTANMTDYEKARVYYTWICGNCDYDYGASDNSISHIAYSLFKNHLAVCDGYTGAYNLLLKLEGISCEAVSNDSHIWTAATLDGTAYHIDTTWGDSSGKYDGTIHYEYFGMTPAESQRVHAA